MGDFCRVCRNQSNHLKSLYDLRCGYPIYVIVMVICPVKIQQNDGLPAFICKGCLEIILNAFKLRDESIASDRFFRDCLAVEGHSTKVETDKTRTTGTVKRAKPSPRSVENEGSNHHVVVDCNMKELKDIESTNKVPASVQGLTFTCSEENCGKVFEMQLCLDIHQGFEHSATAHETPEHANMQDVCLDFQVDISRKDSSSSMAWSFFGSLVDSELVVDDQHYYCRLCVATGTLTKYPKSSSTTTLLHHIRDHHLSIKKKRKRFDDFELSSISQTKKKLTRGSKYL